MTERQAITDVLDRAHGALRGIDAADQTSVIPDKQLDAVSEAIAVIERFARDHGIPLSEFAPRTKPPANRAEKRREPSL
jgi:hypothetical protein